VHCRHSYTHLGGSGYDVTLVNSVIHICPFHSPSVPLVPLVSFMFILVSVCTYWLASGWSGSAPNTLVRLRLLFANVTASMVTFVNTFVCFVSNRLVWSAVVRSGVAGSVYTLTPFENYLAINVNMFAPEPH
jgi:hypothetical protein